MRKARLRAFRLLTICCRHSSSNQFAPACFVCFANLSVSWLCCVVILLLARNCLLIRLIFDLLALKLSQCFAVRLFGNIWTCSRSHDFLNIFSPICVTRFSFLLFCFSELWEQQEFSHARLCFFAARNRLDVRGHRAAKYTIVC